MTFYFLIFFLLFYIAYVDIKERKILNWVCCTILLISFYSIFHIESAAFSNDLQESFISSIFVFLIFFVFYKVSLMGAGDVKLGAVLSFLTGYQFFYVWIFSLLLLFVFFVSRRFLEVQYFHIKFISKIFMIGSVGKVAPYGAFMSIGLVLKIIEGGVL